MLTWPEVTDIFIGQIFKLELIVGHHYGTNLHTSNVSISCDIYSDINTWYSLQTRIDACVQTIFPELKKKQSIGSSDSMFVEYYISLWESSQQSTRINLIMQDSVLFADHCLAMANYLWKSVRHICMYGGVYKMFTRFPLFQVIWKCVDWFNHSLKRVLVIERMKDCRLPAINDNIISCWIKNSL